MTETVDAEVIEDETANLPAVRAAEAMIARGELTVDEVVAQKDKILQIMQRVMTEGIHYGVIPGVNKPSLFKPGAEAINVALRLAPHYQSEKIWHDDGHLTVSVVCELQHIPTGLVIATGEGLCSSRETKYAYRNASRVCPACGKDAIIKGKEEYGGGWVCFKKKDGCGAKYGDNDAAITGQEIGRIDNPDLADTYNTVLKMADKRALIAADLNGTAASDLFTQDVEDRAAAEPAPENSRSEETRSREAVRVDGPGPYPVPKTWAKIEEGVKACDNPDEAWAIFSAFSRAASYHLFGQTEFDKLDTKQQNTLKQKAAGAVVALHDVTAKVDGPFVLFERGEQEAAWAVVLDGVKLETPDYVAPVDAEQATLDEEARRQAEAAA